MKGTRYGKTKNKRDGRIQEAGRYGERRGTTRGQDDRRERVARWDESRMMCIRMEERMRQRKRGDRNDRRMVE